MKIDAFHSLDIIILCGLYGSGKTSFSRQYFKNHDRYRLSRSELRKLLFEMTNFGEPWQAENFNEEDDVLVKHVERKILEHFLHNKRKVLLINTFMTTKSRSRFIKYAKDTHRSIGAIFLNTDVEQCLEHNGKKDINVPSHIISKLNLRKELPSKVEGFNEVMIIKNYHREEEKNNYEIPADE